MSSERAAHFQWTEKHGAWLRDKIQSKGLSIQAVCAECDVERTSVYRWCRGLNGPRDEAVKVALARMFDYESFTDLYRGVNAAIGTSWSRPLDFTTTARILSEIDHEVVTFLMQRDEYAPGEITEFFSGGLEKKFSSRGLDCYDLLRLLHDDDCRRELADSLPDAALVVKVDDNFGQLRFAVDSGEVLVTSPQLLWDCTCTSDQPEHDESCPIHGHSLGAIVDEAFFRRQVTIEYEGAQFRWQDSDALWPPSVDSFQMAGDLKTRGLFTQNIETVLDIGAGTGFLGVLIAAHNRNVKRLDLSDWLLQPQLYGAVNWQLNKPRRSVDFKTHLGILDDWLAEDKKRVFYDAVVCNPPYLPLVSEFPKLACESTVAGTKLLEWVVENGRALGKQVFLQCSDLAMREAQAASDKSNVKLRPVGPKRVVPFRVRHALALPEYIRILSSARGLEHKPEERHQYWHSVRTYLISSD